MEIDEVAANDDKETALIAQAIEGKAEAFGHLYDRYLQRVYRHIYYRVGNISDSQDLAQEVFLRAWRAIPQYRSMGKPFSAWLFTIAHNLVKDHYRRRKGTSPLEELNEEAFPTQPDKEAEAYADKDEIRRCLVYLSPEQQQVLCLRFIDDLDCREVASIMGKKEGAIRVLQHRALAQLRQIMKQEREQDEQ